MRLPELLIVGCQKCGTSTLHWSLSEHDQIHAAVDPETGEEVKEVDFFSHRWEMGLDWYRANFPAADGIGFDASPNYMAHRVALERMVEHHPRAKLVISLRDPVRRIVSQFNHYCQAIDQSQGWDWPHPGESFAENIRTELSRPPEEWKGLLARGRYVEQLRFLSQHFRPEQMLILVLERWSADPVTALDEIQRFAGVTPQTLPLKTSHVRDHTIPPVDDGMLTELREYYRPLNEQLFDLLGDEIAEWT